MTNDGIGTVERAFQLARSGECHSLEDIRRQLKREQYTEVENHLQGISIRKQLAQEITRSEGAGDMRRD